MKIFLVSFFVLMMVTGFGLADTGETRAQIQASFGNSVDAAGRQCIYQQNAEFRLVTFEHEVSIAEHRFKQLTPEQCKKLYTPRLLFPAQSHPIEGGIGLYEFSFDAYGRLGKVSVIQSANGLLDRYTEGYAPLNWRGPSDSSVTLALAYHRTGDSHCVIYGR